MSTHQQQRRWADSESPPPSAIPRIAVQTTFRHMETSPAVAARVDAEAQKLLRYFDRITHCHVVIAAPHRHHRHGRHYAVHVELSVPGERLMINHEPNSHSRPENRHLTKADEVQAPHQDIYVVVREVFDSARRQLEDYVRRQRGDVKHHQSPTNDARQDETVDRKSTRLNSS